MMIHSGEISYFFVDPSDYCTANGGLNKTPTSFGLQLIFLEQGQLTNLYRMNSAWMNFYSSGIA